MSLSFESKLGAVKVRDFVRAALINRKDEFGNTMLHLAAWNNKKDMFDHLIDLGADLKAINQNGLTPYTLSVRFGLWDMAQHIWKKNFTTVYWNFGNIISESVEYQAFKSESHGLASFTSGREIDECLKSLIVYFLRIQKDEKPVKGKEHRHEWVLVEKAANEIVNTWCYGVIRQFFITEYNISKVGETNNYELLPETRRLWHNFIRENGLFEINRRKEKARDMRRHKEKSALQIITIFRPKEWYEHCEDLMHEVVTKKWMVGYYLVHAGYSLIPYCILILLFGMMWWQRRLSILEHSFWWSEEPVRAPHPSPHDSVVTESEGSCGWASIWNSQSGAMQLALVVYGVPSLLWLAARQSRLRPTDLDEDLDWRITTDELINFVFINLESILHVIVAGLFVTICTSRIAAGPECDVAYVGSEKNATAIAALMLFFNLFIICKPYKRFGLLVLTWYRFLLSDVYNFLFMYLMMFAAFLVAIQTLHNANLSYIVWMEQTDTVFPRVQAAIKNQYPLAEGNLTYLVGSNSPSADQLLATETALDGCSSFRRSLLDTAFSLLEISFGDGLADALEQARTKPYNCAGFQPDVILGCLLVAWVFLTNTLIMNLLIAMMNNTFEKQQDTLTQVWLLDLSQRIMWFEIAFPGLSHRIDQQQTSISMLNRSYWLAKLNDLLLILYCLPEVHLVISAVNAVRVWLERRRLAEKNEWRGILESLKTSDTVGTESNLSTSYKAVAYGSQAEEKCSYCSQEEEARLPLDEHERVIMLIYRLERLKSSLHNSKISTRRMDLNPAKEQGDENESSKGEKESEASSALNPLAGSG